MTDEKKKAIMNCTSFDEILNEEMQKPSAWQRH